MTGKQCSLIIKTEIRSQETRRFIICQSKGQADILKAAELSIFKITMEGKDLNYDKIREAVENYGASIHSIDEVVAGKRLVEEVTTPQD